MDTEANAENTTPTNEREIDGVTYRVQPLAFSAGLPILKRLIDIVAPIAAAALRGGSANGMYANVLDVAPQAFTEKDLERFADAFGPRSQYLNDAGQWVTLIKNAKVDNRETHFTGRYLAFMRWLIFCVEVNFAGFFNGATKEGESDESPIKRILKMVAPEKSKPSDSGTHSNIA